jgi:hypothetical protein
MRILVFGGLLAAAISCAAHSVGIFDDTRLYSSAYNLETGSSMTQVRAIWEARGAYWNQTGVLTTEFLATVDVFYTSNVNLEVLTFSEQDALESWVKAGGTLVLTGECG